MPYIINFTDSENKTPITVFDNTSSNDTSLTFPGRNVTGYGQIIAENFLALLENFSNASEPINPVEGQLWYDSSDGTQQLKIWDNTEWKAASGIQRGPTAPAIEESKIGELWVDTTKQQLNIFTGNRWILVGPTESSIDGLRYGPSVEQILDTDDNDRVILILYIADQPVVVVSKDTFIPKISIQGFESISSGLNVIDPKDASQIALFEGGALPKLIGTASNADALNVGGVEISASRFLRSDTTNTTEFSFNIRNNLGLTIGADGNLNISTTSTTTRVYNSTPGASIDLQVNRNSVASTILRVVDNTVGINSLDPSYELDVGGDIGLSGSLIVSGVTETTNLNNGSIKTEGGLAVKKSVRIGQNLYVSGVTNTENITPASTEFYNIGTPELRWNSIYSKDIIGDTITGTIVGDIQGNSQTATSLASVSTFEITGDIVSQRVTFDGSPNTQIEFSTSLSSNLLKQRTSVDLSEPEDQVLVYRAAADVLGDNESAGLLRQTRETFVGDLGLPIGTILPYAGPNAPNGFLLCDGSELEINQYSVLYGVIGDRYNGDTALAGLNTFRLPDLRGRFPLGRHNMNNSRNVPTSTGSLVSAGGGEPEPPRVEGIEASVLAGSAGQSSAQLGLTNIPQHEHSMFVDGVQYFAVRVDNAIRPAAETNNGPTAPGQAQYLNRSGGVLSAGRQPLDADELGQAFGIMNPYLTINYIIRVGQPDFSRE